MLPPIRKNDAAAPEADRCCAPVRMTARLPARKRNVVGAGRQERVTTKAGGQASARSNDQQRQDPGSTP